MRFVTVDCRDYSIFSDNGRYRDFTEIWRINVSGKPERFTVTGIKENFDFDLVFYLYLNRDTTSMCRFTAHTNN